MIVVAGRGQRLRTTGVWVVSALITGGFWFIRNLIEAGNPLPWIKAGPLVGPDQLDIDIREPHTVAHYLFPPDTDGDPATPSSPASTRASATSGRSCSGWS